MKLSNIKIGFRLGLGFAVVVSLLAIVSSIAILRISGINQLNDRILDDRYLKVMLAKQIQFEVNSQARNLRNAIISHAKPEEVSFSIGKMEASVAKVDELMRKLDAAISSDKGKQLFAKMSEARAAYGTVRKATAKLLADGQAEAAGTYLIKDGRPIQNAFFDAIESMAEFQDGRMRADAKQAHDEGDAAVALTLALAVAGCVTAVLIGVLITRSITRPINQAVQLAQTVAAGDLSSTIEVHGRDEVALLLQALKQMNVSLQQMVGQVRGGADEIATATREVAHGNMDLSTRTEQQAGALEETASSMEELTSTVKQNSDNARQANQLAVSAADVARKGGQVVSEVVTTMAAISASAGKISDIIGVIDGIAFQTNILALNAAVEAARAGEQGRGFAVVATEVRNLAQRSAAAAKEIKTLIGDSVDRVAVGNKLVVQAGSTMDEVVSSVQRVTDIMAEISEASSEQEAGIAQINEAISGMDAVTQQNAALVEQAAAATAALQEQAAALSSVVGAFKLSGDGQTARVAAAAPRARVAPKPVARLDGPRQAAGIARSALERAKRAEVKADVKAEDWVEF